MLSVSGNAVNAGYSASQVGASASQGVTQSQGAQVRPNVQFRPAEQSFIAPGGQNSMLAGMFQLVNTMMQFMMGLVQQLFQMVGLGGAGSAQVGGAEVGATTPSSCGNTQYAKDDAQTQQAGGTEEKKTKGALDKAIDKGKEWLGEKVDSAVKWFGETEIGKTIFGWFD